MATNFLPRSESLLILIEKFSYMVKRVYIFSFTSTWWPFSPVSSTLPASTPLIFTLLAASSPSMLGNTTVM